MSGKCLCFSVAETRFSETVLVCVLLFVLAKQGNSVPHLLKIGVFYDDGDTSEEKQLLRAVEKLNMNASDAERTSLDINGLSTPYLSFAVQRLNPKDAFHSAKKVCRLLEEGMLAVLGPRHPTTSSLVTSACARHRVPHIYLDREEGPGPPWDSASLTLGPSPEELGIAFRDLVVAQRWTRFTIVYERPDALIRLRWVLELASAHASPPLFISLRLMPEGQDHRPVLRQISQNGESNLLLDVGEHRLGSVLRYALKMGLLTEYHSYVVTTLDLHTVDLSVFQNSRANITGLQLIGREHWEQDPGVAARQTYARTGIYPLFLRNRNSRKPLKVDSALAQDSLELLVRASVSLAQSGNLSKPPRVQCYSNGSSVPRTQSGTFVDIVKNLSFSGLTGPVHLDSSGRRRNITFHVVQLKKTGLASIGTWSPAAGFKTTRTTSMLRDEILDTLKNKTFQITTLISPPYVMLKDSAEKLGGNDRFEGYCVDLVRELADMLGFRYELRLVRDGAYGSRDSRGRWNGMIRELIDREADLAVADLTITYLREEAVDFTTPFMTLGIGILFRKPQRADTLLFFLKPLSLDVWIYTAVAYVGVSLLLVFVSRLSSGKWTLTRPCCCCMDASTCDQNVRMRNRLTLLNSLWFTLSAIMQQGYDISPRSAAARMGAAVWWFFSFVMVSSYTANLTAFLTRERLQTPIQGAEDLVKQSNIEYGCVRSGSTEAFFKESKYETYERMWQAMSRSLTHSNAEGVERVMSGGYAFLMESTSIEYLVERHCELTQIGGLLDSKGYGIATPSGSPYRSHLSSAILKLQENGVLQSLKRRWWQEHNNRGCAENAVIGSSANKASPTNEMGLARVGGVFVVLLTGLGIACVIAFVEFMWKARPARQELSSPLQQKTKEAGMSSVRPSGTVMKDPRNSALQDLLYC